MKTSKPKYALDIQKLENMESQMLQNNLFNENIFIKYITKERIAKVIDGSAIYTIKQK